MARAVPGACFGFIRSLPFSAGMCLERLPNADALQQRSGVYAQQSSACRVRYPLSCRKCGADHGPPGAAGEGGGVSVVVPADRCTGEAPLKNASAGCLSYCLNRFVLRWSSDVGSSLKEIVRQQRNLSPPESVREVDEYQVAGATGLEPATFCVSEAD